MIDRDKVTDALRNCINKPRCQDCPWEECSYEHEEFKLPKGLVMDILDLLKGRKKVRMLIEGGGSSWWYVCEECQTAVDKKDKFCRQCGGEFV